ncbi:hypothetical protein MHTCC0001_28770 [Flavobacteriaceae bacterium MHTCC 0001]
MHHFENKGTKGNLTNNTNVEFYPHGVIRMQGINYIHLKALITLHPYENASDDYTSSQFKGLQDQINAYEWSYSFSADSKLHIRVKKEAVESFPDKLSFYKRVSAGNYQELNGFSFGNYITDGGREQEAFLDLLETPNMVLYNRETEESFAGSITQAPVKEAPQQFENASGESNYRNVLGRAYTNAIDVFDTIQIRNSRIQGPKKINFITLYSHILDEPLIAEEFYGIMRSIFIPIDKIPSTFKKYDITFQGSLVTDNAPFEFYKKGEKYYHGLHKSLINLQSGKDFEKVWMDFQDSYHNELNEKTKNLNANPEGYFLKAVYKQDGNGVITSDPFEENKHIAGFNVVVKDQGQYQSLSLHKKEVQLLKPFRLTFEMISSGIMNPQTNIEESTNKSYRSNLLMTWKGENLMVNRVSRDLVEEKEGVKLDTREFHDESDIIDCHFQPFYHFIQGGNVPLYNEKPHSFYLRTVTPTGYYSPTLQELEINDPDGIEMKDITLTVDQFFNEEFAYPAKEMSRPSINSPIIIGRKTYQNAQSDYVDRADHLVLNQLKNERKEKRYVYPPIIKFQDFRFEKNLTPNSIEADSLGEFVKKCMELEQRSLQMPRSIPSVSRRVDYLADIRANLISCYAANLYTNSALFKKERLQAFQMTEKYPFYRRTKGARLTASLNGGTYDLEIENSGLYSNLSKGMYRFYLKTHVDGISTAHVPFSLSIVDKPDIPKAIKQHKVIRNILKGSLWNLQLDLEADDISRKSLKYIEETEVLKLQHQNLNSLFQQYKRKVSKQNGAIPELLNHEYPYGMFLTKEGNLKTQDDLRENAYPKQISIDVKLPSKFLLKNREIFRIKISPKYELICGFMEVLPGNPAAGSLLTIHFIDFDGKKNRIVIPVNNLLEIKITFIKDRYEIQFNNDAPIPLKEYIHPDITHQDIIINDTLSIEKDNKTLVISEDAEGYLSMLLNKEASDLNEYRIELKRSKEHVFLVDEKHPFYRKKKIKLFASSAFQGYFPKSNSEFDMGSEATEDLAVEVYNNCRPSTPELTIDLLMYNKQDNSWVQSGGKNLKDNKSEHLLRINLDQDFMREGANSLGIVLRKKDSGVEETTSAIGEDITKLAGGNWNNNELLPFLNQNNNLEAINKYIKGIVNIGSDEVLECQPFYDTKRKKWQVILSFNHLIGKETAFVRLIALKIAKGYDGSTSYSDLTTPEIVPIYNHKHFGIERINFGGVRAIKIFNARPTDYKEKMYAVVLSNTNSKATLFNHTKIGEEPLKNFSEIRSLTMGDDDSQTEYKKIIFHNKNQIVIERDTSKSLYIFEFEVHENYSSPALGSDQFEKYIDFNPLFDKEAKGLRLIHMEKFKL